MRRDLKGRIVSYSIEKHQSRRVAYVNIRVKVSPSHLEKLAETIKRKSKKGFHGRKVRLRLLSRM